MAGHANLKLRYPPFHRTQPFIYPYVIVSPPIQYPESNEEMNGIKEFLIQAREQGGQRAQGGGLLQDGRLAPGCSPSRAVSVSHRIPAALVHVPAGSSSS
jgi:hypothetical protein